MLHPSRQVVMLLAECEAEADERIVDTWGQTTTYKNPPGNR